MKSSPISVRFHELFIVFKQTKMYILVDSEDRENEGDLIIPGSSCTADHVNFMASYGKGLICLSISELRASELKLPLMNPNNWKKKTTAFTVSIEASEGITTGISAEDRAKTVQAAVNPNFKVGDIDLNKTLSMKGIKFKIISKNLITASYEKSSLNFGEIVSYFNQNNIKIEDIATDDGDLEDVFVQLTKH